MKNFYLYRQNNSGGSFTYPAVQVFVEASSLEEAETLASEYITLCTSGRYADCGCCPCCGHRWPEPLEVEGRDVTVCATYMGATGAALIEANGTLTRSDTPQGMQHINDYLRSMT